MKSKIILLVMAALALGAGPAAVEVGFYHSGNPCRSALPADHVNGQLIIKSAGITASPAGNYTGILAAHASEIRDIHFDSRSGYTILQAQEGVDLEVLRRQLLKEKWVTDVSYNYFATMSEQIPSDYLFDYQYALKNTGQVIVPSTGYSGTSGADIKASEGWDWTVGSETQTIAVVDTGVAITHEDLIDKVVDGYNFVADSTDVQDDEGHGTIVASIAAAETNNGVGLAGTCWKAKIMPVKVLDNEGLGTYLAIGAGIKYAVDNDARVITLGFTGTKDSFILRDACQYAFENNCLVVAPSGNDGDAAVSYPAAYDEYCLAVGASDAKDQRASWSNYGPQLDVVAPGVWVYGAAYDPDTPTDLRSYVQVNGTSFAVPYVSGAIALLLSLKPDLTALQVMDLVKFTADDVNQATNPGPDVYMGYGRINLKRLLGPFILN